MGNEQSIWLRTTADFRENCDDDMDAAVKLREIADELDRLTSEVETLQKCNGDKLSRISAALARSERCLERAEAAESKVTALQAVVDRLLPLEQMARCLYDLDWCNGYELGTEKNSLLLDEACELARAYILTREAAQAAADGERVEQVLASDTPEYWEMLARAEQGYGHENTAKEFWAKAKLMRKQQAATAGEVRTMNHDTSVWLRGQIEAVRRANAAVHQTMALHCPEAARELQGIEYACNRASNALERAAVDEGQQSSQSGGGW